MAKASGERIDVEAAGRTVSISSPSKVFFPEHGYTKLQVVQYYLTVAEGALRGAGGRPNVLVRYANGVAGEYFYQKRAPAHPEWLEVVALKFPSGRTAEELVPRDAAALAWMANLGCLELHPHPIRPDDLDHPDELRIDLDPVPGVEWPQLQAVARVVHETLNDLELVGWPKTSGSRGIHVNVRIARNWSYNQVRRAAQAFAREVARRAPAIATAKWWKEERHGVFLDYNQNAKDKTVASAYSIRPKPDARVSAPVTWAELDVCNPADFTLATMPARFAQLGDLHAGIDAAVCVLDGLLELAKRQERDGAAAEPGATDGDTAPAKKKRAPAKKAAPAKAADGAVEEEAEHHGRVSKFPLIEIGRAEHKEEAQAGLERWKLRHPAVAALLEPADVLVDAMRGRYATWTRIRVNLQHVPVEQRPPQEALDPDYDPGDTRPVNAGGARRSRKSPAAETSSD